MLRGLNLRMSAAITARTVPVRAFSSSSSTRLTLALPAACAAPLRAWKPVTRVTAPAAALTASARFFASTPVGAPSKALAMRSSGSNDIREQNSPMNWQSNGGNSGGSQADSLTPYVRQHLQRVYGLLAVAVGVAGMGSFLMIATPLAKIIPFWLPMIGGFVPLLWLSFAPPANPTLKLGLFLSFALLEGMAIAPIVLVSTMKGVLTTALVLTGAVFCGFSAAAYLAPRASLVAWQGPLFGALIGLVAISLINVFYPTAIAHSLILYGGLALFSVMVSVDTQAMIERARCGAGDHVQDAMNMFLNMVNIFIRIAQMLVGRSDD